MAVVLALAFPCTEFISLAPIKIKGNLTHGERLINKSLN